MTEQQRFFTRPRLWGLLGGVALTVAQFFSPAGAGTAQAAPVCTTSGDYMVCTFNYTGATETWTVPAGVTEATFDLYGASGVASDLSIGRGGRVMATLAVTPGATYQIQVGGMNGYNGGGKGFNNSQNGGGASDLRATPFALANRLLVAGGGGGGGRGGGSAPSAGVPGGPGGDGGYPSGAAGLAAFYQGPGGSGGTQSAGGSNMFPGSLGQGGSVSSPTVTGGGGGGGYYGGGAGFGSNLSGGSGGGGGSSYGPQNALFQNGARYGDGLVILTYRVKSTTVTPVCSSTIAQITCTVSLAYTGAPQLWTVPPGVTQATFDLYGAQGGPLQYVSRMGSSGKGARAQASLAVTPGTTYQILVGGQNGFNGGGAGGSAPRTYSGSNGGGATDLRRQPFELADRLLVAGGGGGAGASVPARETSSYDQFKDPKLADGGDSGMVGRSGWSSPEANGGGGGRQDGGGAGGSLAFANRSSPGRAGSLGLGGAGGDLIGYAALRGQGLGGGGGGGGYYGGGSGGGGFLHFSPVSSTPSFDHIDYGFAAGGGGGSSYGPATATFEIGVRGGNGALTITYNIQDPPLPTNGVVTVWGDNTYGQLNMLAGLSGVVKIATGYRHTLALKNDGTVVAWGYNAYGQSSVPAGLTGVIALSAGDRHSLALKSDGTVVAWGENSQGQINLPVGLNNVVAIASGPYHNLALKADGTVVSWGGNEGGQLNIPAELNNVTAIATGMAFAVALKSDGTVVAWGDNTYKQLNVPAGLSGVIKIATGRLHTLAIKADGSVVAWGYNCCYQIAVPAGLNNVSALTGGGYHSLALKRDGTMVSWGDNTAGQRNLPAGLGGVAAMSAGGFHTVLLSQDSGFLGGSAGGGVAAASSVADTAAISATVPLAVLQMTEEPPPAVAVAPDVAETAAPDSVGQGQRLFLPLVANTSMMTADNSAAGAPVTEAAPQSAAVTTTVATTLTLSAADPNASASSQPVTTTAGAAVITTSAPISVPVVMTAPVVTESAPVSAPVAVESASVVSDSVPVSEPAAVVAVAPVVTETLLLTTTEPITAADAAANPLAGTAVGNRGGMVVLALVGLAVVGSLLWQRRRSSVGR